MGRRKKQAVAFGGLIVGSSEIFELDAQMRALNTEIIASDASIVGPDFRFDWTAFFLRWLEWRAAHDSFLAQTGLPNFDSGGVEAAAAVGPEFDAFVAGYNEHRRQFVKMGQATDTKAIAPSSGPVGDAVDAIAGAGKTVAEVALVVGAGVLLALILSRK